MIYVRIEKGNKTLSEFMEACYNNSVSKQYFYFVESFSDEALLERECHSARRSFEDLLEIAQTYYPTTTAIDLMKVIGEIREDGFSKYMSHYCSTIEKHVFIRRGTQSYSYTTFSSTDKDNIRGKGVYTRLELIDLLDEANRQSRSEVSSI